MTRSLLRLALVALPLATLPACITETVEGSSPIGVRTEGVIVSGSVDAVWGRTEAVIASMATAPLTSRGIPNSLRTEVMGKEVTAFAEAYDSSRTVVHVTSEDDELADRIRLRVMHP